MTEDEPLPDVEEAARGIADDDDRWVQKAEPVSRDLIELLVVSGHSMNSVAKRVGVDPSTVKRRKRLAFWPMETVQQRDWLAAVLKRALTMRWARVDPNVGDALKHAIEAACVWRPTAIAPYALLRGVAGASAPAVIGARGLSFETPPAAAPQDGVLCMGLRIMIL